MERARREKGGGETRNRPAGEEEDHEEENDYEETEEGRGQGVTQCGIQGCTPLGATGSPRFAATCVRISLSEVRTACPSGQAVAPKFGSFLQSNGTPAPLVPRGRALSSQLNSPRASRDA